MNIYFIFNCIPVCQRCDIDNTLDFKYKMLTVLPLNSSSDVIVLGVRYPICVLSNLLRDCFTVSAPLIFRRTTQLQRFFYTTIS